MQCPVIGRQMQTLWCLSHLSINPPGALRAGNSEKIQISREYCASLPLLTRSTISSDVNMTEIVKLQISSMHSNRIEIRRNVSLTDCTDIKFAQLPRRKSQRRYMSSPQKLTRRLSKHCLSRVILWFPGLTPTRCKQQMRHILSRC